MPNTGDSCDFCQFTSKHQQVIEASAHFWVVYNNFSYDIWDNFNVAHHYMLVPRRHITSLAELSQEEAHDYVVLLAAYESKGFSVYARAPQNASKSIQHQHTHLLKLTGKAKKISFFLRKPYVLLSH